MFGTIDRVQEGLEGLGMKDKTPPFRHLLILPPILGMAYRHIQDYDFGYAVGRDDAFANMGAKKDPSICGEPTYFVRQQKASFLMYV